MWDWTSWFSSLNICSISCISSLWNEKLSSWADKIFYLDWKYWWLACQPWECYFCETCLTETVDNHFIIILYLKLVLCVRWRDGAVRACSAPPNSLLIVEHCCWLCWTRLGPSLPVLSRISPAPSPARSDPADPAVLRRIVRMAVLVEGQKFALSSKSQTSKSVVYVKLTDSALRSLEDYLKNKVR